VCSHFAGTTGVTMSSIKRAEQLAILGAANVRLVAIR
jgi:hypothetical protein